MPGLVELLPGGVQLVQQLGDPLHQALGVCVAGGVAAAAREGLAALDALEQPGRRRVLVFWPLDFIKLQINPVNTEW